jgi:hypothetical protein
LRRCVPDLCLPWVVATVGSWAGPFPAPLLHAAPARDTDLWTATVRVGARHRQNRSADAPAVFGKSTERFENSLAPRPQRAEDAGNPT